MNTTLTEQRKAIIKSLLLPNHHSQRDKIIINKVNNAPDENIEKAYNLLINKKDCTNYDIILNLQNHE